MFLSHSTHVKGGGYVLTFALYCKSLNESYNQVHSGAHTDVCLYFYNLNSVDKKTNK